MPLDNKQFIGSVYSTEHGAMCAVCGKPIAACNCKALAKLAPKGNGNVRVFHETKGRKGKGLTVITGLPIQGEALEKLAKKLKQICGAGGCVREGSIEIQGDHRDFLTAELVKNGFAAKRSGG